MDLKSYTFAGHMTYMTFKGVEDVPIEFNLIVAPDADEDALEYAAKALSLFLMDAYAPDPEREDEDEMN